VLVVTVIDPAIGIEVVLMGLAGEILPAVIFHKGPVIVLVIVIVIVVVMHVFRIEDMTKIPIF